MSFLLQLFQTHCPSLHTQIYVLVFVFNASKLIYAAQMFFNRWSFIDVWLTCPVLHSKRELSFQQLKTANSFFMGFHAHFPSPCWDLICFLWSCACCHSYYKFLCAAPLLCLENTVPFWSSITYGSHTVSAPSTMTNNDHLRRGT